MLALVQRAKQSNITFEGSLDFLNDWQYFAVGPFLSSTASCREG